MGIGTTPSAHGCSPRERPSYSYAGPNVMQDGIRPTARSAGASQRQVDSTDAARSAFARNRIATAMAGDRDLHGLDLHGLDLHGLNFTSANLQAANLQAANLNLANLAGANLAGADLTGASLNSTLLTAANLTGTIGLSR